ncbi:HIT family protein [Actinopolyspora halophila]|uniref:HIT family protein n=1 Tax=Actinopolyspora halophila TaxID=1850 RepID=UPI001B7F89F1|nr:hypothetical protein [Actinopolyspora halophila]
MNWVVIVADCTMCRGVDADPDLMRVQVWEDENWRLTTAVVGEAPGFSFLEPKRHIRYVHELDGEEATTFGTVLAESTTAIKEATGAELVYVYIFGGSFDHLHLHLAPQTTEGPFNDCMLKGRIVEKVLDNGAVVQSSEDYPLLPKDDLQAAAEAIRAARIR